ncbi:transmembrane repetitive protein, partial [Lysobacteraceae bacterium NML93-0831]
GPTAGAPPGAAPSTRAADDWGDGASARDGGQRGSPSGLLGADGRPRLADGGRVGGGLPPGTITEDFARIDREGTWLRRPPTDYEPTSFDRFWVPSETLLEEWVRRSIKTVLIPIPGTSKTIRCNVALLAFGGGCGISDPNMQDVETDGRPPPDVPWKPELQEDQGSLGG